MAVLVSGLLDVGFWDAAILNDMIYMVNGVDRNRRYDGTNTHNMGIRMDGGDPTNFAETTGGALTVLSTYKYIYTYYNKDNRVESIASGIGTQTLTGSNNSITFDVPANASYDAQITTIRIYRTGADAALFFLEQEQDYSGSLVSITSTAADTSLTTAYGAPTLNGTAQEATSPVPPTQRYIESFKSRLWLAGNNPYTVGTAAVTQSSATVTITTGEVTDGMIGMKFVVSGSARYYSVSDADTGANTLTLSEVFEEATNATSNYTVYNEGNYLWYSFIDSNGVSYPDSVQTTAWLPVGKDDGDKITGMVQCHDRLLITKENHLYLLSGNSPSTYDILEVASPVGCSGNQTLARNEGGDCIFYGGRGVYITDGVRVSCVSNAIEPLFTNEGSPPWTVDHTRNYLSHGVYDHKRKRYYLWVTSSGSTVTDKCLVADFNLMDDNGQPAWFPWDLPANVSGTLRSNDELEVYIGDESGFVYKLNTGLNDGAGTTGTKSGTATSTASNSLTDSAATFYTTGDGLKGAYIEIISGTAAGEKELIASNTTTKITLNGTWSVTPDTTSVYKVGNISAYIYSKDLTFDSMNSKIMKEMRILHPIETSAVNMTFDYYLDGSTTSQETITMDFSQAQGYEREFFTDNKFRHMNYKFAFNDVDLKVELDEVQIEAEERGT